MRSRRGFFRSRRYLKSFSHLLAIAAVPVSQACAQTDAVWDGSSGSWTDGARWSIAPLFPADGQPGTGDTWNARIGAGVVTLDTVLGVQRLVLEGGTLRLQQSGTFGVATGFDWSGGILRGSPDNPLQIASGAVSTWTGTLDLRTAHVLNSGALTLADGFEGLFEADFDADAGLRNEVGGVLTLAGSGSWRSDWFGEGPTPDSLRNQGTLHKNGAGTFTVGAQPSSSGGAPAFQNSGTVNVNVGTLELEVAAVSSGTWNIAEGARLIARGAQATSDSLFQGAGDVDFTGSATVAGVYAITGTTSVSSFISFNTTGPTAFTSLVMGGSTNLSGSAALSVTDSLTWGGTIGGSAVAQTFSLVADATGVIPANTNATLSTRTFNNAGSLSWTGGATQAGSILGFFGNAVFNNLAGATFTAAGNGTGGTTGSGGSTRGTFNNAGEFVKTGADTTTRLNWSFANSGLVSAEAGRLEIATLTTAGGSFEVAADAALYLRRNSGFDASTFPFTGVYDVASGGSLEFARGHLQASAVFPSAAGTVTFAGDMFISRDSVPATLLRFTGDGATTGFARIAPPSGTFTAGRVELVEGGGISSSASAGRVRITDSFAWTGGFVAGGTVELAAGSTTTLSGTGSVSSGTLQIDGAFQFQPGAQLRVGANAVVRPGATLTVGDGASVFLAPSTSAAQDATIRGGTVVTTGTGVLRVGATRSVVSGSSYGTLDGVAFSGTVELTQNLSVLRLVNDSTINGRVRYTAVAPARFTAFELHQSGTLADVEFEDVTPLGNAKAVVAIIGNRTVTFGPTVRLSRVQNVTGDYFNESTGQLIETGAAHLVNEGRIATDGAGRFTSLAALASFENRGVLQVTDGARIDSDLSFTQTAGRITIGAGSTFRLTNPAYRPSTQLLTLAGGVLEGAGTFSGNVALSGGTIAPGASPGLLTIQGNLSATSGDFAFELGGTGRGTDFDALDLTGTLDLVEGGANLLSLTFIDGFETEVSSTDTFNLITAGGLSGVFTHIANGARLFDSDGRGSFVVNYGPTSPFGSNSVVLSNYVAVPEPANATTFGALAAVAMVGLHRRRRSV